MCSIPHATSPPAHGLSISPNGVPNSPHPHRDSNASTSPVRESHLAHSSQVAEPEAPEAPTAETAAAEVAAPAPVTADAQATKPDELMATE